MSDQNPLEDDVAEQITALMRETLPGRVQDTPQQQKKSVPAVTLSEVAARVQFDASREGGLDAADARALQSLAALREKPLPARLTPRSVADYLATLGIAASPRFCEVFAATAIFLRMGRQQTLHLANAKKPASGGLL
jgi:hypothetical protein